MRCSECGKGKCQCSAAWEFPPKARGGTENPAEVTSVGFSVGSLTNKPAFRNIAPVRAKDAEKISPADAGQATRPQPGEQSAGNTQQKVQRMKVKFVQACGTYTVGQEAELGQDAPEIAAGAALPVGAADRLLKMVAERKARDVGAIKAAFERGVKRGAFAPKDEAPLTLACSTAR
jgi:hypothetical protein